MEFAVVVLTLESWAADGPDRRPLPVMPRTLHPSALLLFAFRDSKSGEPEPRLAPRLHPRPSRLALGRSSPRELPLRQFANAATHPIMP